MKPVIHHVHSHSESPYHGLRYYLVIAACLLVPGLAYVLWQLMVAKP